MIELPHPKVLTWVVQEHLDELDALWDRREVLVFDDEWTLDDLAEHEARAFAHFRGLRAGKGHTLDRAREALEGDDRGAATAATFACSALGASGLRDEIVERLGSADPEVAHGIRIALRHQSIDDIAPALRALADGESAIARACALDVLAFHRVAQDFTPRVQPEGSDPEADALVLAAIGRCGGALELETVVSALGAEEPFLRRSAVEAAIRRRVPGLVESLREIAFASPEPTPEVLEALAFVGGPADVSRLVSTLAESEAGEDAAAGAERDAALLAALGAAGTGAAVEALLAAMSAPMRLHAAGAAFLRITGAPDLEPESPVAAPEDLSEEERDFWDEWPPVDPARARSWWQANAQRFAGEGRFQAGEPMGAGPVAASFPTLPLAARRGEFLRAWTAAPEATVDLELEAAASVQRSQQMRLAS